MSKVWAQYETSVTQAGPAITWAVIAESGSEGSLEGSR